jgi:hypothetical protein
VKENNCQVRLLLPGEILFEDKNEIKAFSDK